MNDNSIFVGDKPFLNYVTGIVLQFTMYEEDKVVVMARGKFISRAVDIAQATVKRFLNGKVTVESTHIDSEEAVSKEGEKVRVSLIEITLKRTY